MTTFLKPCTFTGKQLQASWHAHDFSLTAADLQRKLWLTSTEKESPKHHPILSILVSVLNLDPPFQSRTLWLWDNTKLSRFQLIWLFLVSGAVCCRRHWKCCHALWLLDHSFGYDYAVLINEWQSFARAVLTLDENNTVPTLNMLDNINTEPDYDAAIAAVKSFLYR